MIALNLLVMVAIYLYAFFKGGSTEVVSFNPLNIMVGPSSDV